MGISLSPQHLKRYKDLSRLFLKYGSKDLLTAGGAEEKLLDEDREESPVAKIEDLPGDLEKLGPTYIKLGQFLSTRSDMLPEQYLLVLERLQDGVQQIPFSEVEEILSKEIPMRFSKAFKDFDVEPVGAASIGQVHKAILPDGREVVVKIQRPGIRAKIIEDLAAFDEIGEFVQEHTEMGKRYMIHSMIEEFRKAILRELDYKNEVQNLKILSANLSEFEDIVVPLPVEDYCTSKVLTMDFIKGTKITSISPLKKLDLDGKKIAESLFKAYLKQILIDGFYHSDPHPGNVFITDDNKLALLDLGMVGYISGELQSNLLHIMLAIGDGRGDEVADYAIKIGKQTEFFNKQEFKSQLNELIAINRSTKLGDLELGRIILEMTKVSGRNGILVPNELTMLGKTLLNLDKVGKTLDPLFDPNESIQRNANELMKKKFSKSASSQKPYEILLEAKEFFEKLPSRVNKIMDKVTDDEIKIKVNAVDEVYLMNGFQKVANRITMGLIIAALIIGAALIMRLETSFKIIGYPGLAMIFFLMAAIGGIMLVYRIIFVDEMEMTKSNKQKRKI
ncbi:MAG: AarF/UbiB family protein [Ignavibacteria bacterium]